MREVFVIGDSHVVAIRDGFRLRQWKTWGGPFQSGQAYESEFFACDGRSVAFLDADAERRLEKNLKSAGVSSLLDLKMPIVSTIGFNTHRYVARFSDFTLDPDGEGQFVSSAAFRAAVIGSRRHALAFYERIGHLDAFAVYSPQRFSGRKLRDAQRFEEELAAAIAETGVRMIDVRARTTDATGQLDDCYRKATDPTHANPEFGARVADRLAEMLDA